MYIYILYHSTQIYTENLFDVKEEVDFSPIFGDLHTSLSAVEKSFQVISMMVDAIGYKINLNFFLNTEIVLQILSDDKTILSEMCKN